MNEYKEIALIERITFGENLSTYDPYDIWKSEIGVKVKRLYYFNKYVGFIPATILTIYDHYFNNSFRIGYKKQEYPIVRAQAALSLLNLYHKTPNDVYLVHTEKHITWLLDNYSENYSGLCWGTGFKIVISNELVYKKETPFTTNTPYILEVFHEYYRITKDIKVLSVIKSIYNFYERDILILFEDSDTLITSYGPFKDRIVSNAVSYTMYVYSIFYLYLPNKDQIMNKIIKMFQFIKNVQNEDGSWMYAPYDEYSFIDCFHSCFILKNIYKVNNIISLEDSDLIIGKGYKFLKDSFIDRKKGLYKRFAIKNKIGIIKYDLYDNCEMLSLAYLLNDESAANGLLEAIDKHFISKDDIYSAIDIFNLKKNKNTLRWAVMPYILALSMK